MEIRETQFQIEKTTNTKALQHELGELEQQGGQYNQGELTAINFAFMEQKKNNNALEKKKFTSLRHKE